ncbi:hypothetical protein [Neobacillus cucumis]|uniref:Uncharacterized protein n=1 Tax=Neobacillus cucumis TaxID=1740721 RepID=A0A2N5HXW0_9BACI|nr:hypothetical protein [Neobacillus cucumis]PLS10365.1 hypothetical protein CVD27_00015 [Neobacillus cucumis]
MKLKGPFISLLAIAAVLSTLLIYWFYFSPPKSFPTKSQLIKEINHSTPRASVKIIQDTVHIDKGHVFVPYISKDGQYGVSFWVWERHKWEMESLSTNGSPRIWKIDRNNPASYYILWNLHPDDGVKDMDFYLIRERGYQGINGRMTYIPKIQMETKIALKKKSYGMMLMPDEWDAVMGSLIKGEKAKAPWSVFDSLTSNYQVYFGWIPYDQKDKVTVVKNSITGEGYTSGANIDESRILSPSEIETPLE